MVLVFFSAFYLHAEGKKPVVDIDSMPSYMGKAYGYYLTGAYNKAVYYYKKVHEIDPQNSDAHIGLLDSYIALKQYRRVLSAGRKTENWREDFFILQKLALACVYLNKSQEADSLFNRAMHVVKENSSVPEYMLKDFVLTLGNRYLETHDYRKSQYWFEVGDSLFGTEEFQNGIEATRIARKDRKTYTSTMYGIISYRGDTQLNRGAYGAISSGVIWRNRHKLQTSYALLHIEADTGTNDPDGTPGDGEEEKKKKPKDKDTTTVAIESENLNQHDIHLSYTDLVPSFKNTRFAGGVRLSFSNIRYSHFAISGYAGGESSLGSFTGGIFCYITSLPEHLLFQLSPLLCYDLTWKDLFCRIRTVPSIIQSIRLHSFMTNIPSEWQVSGDLSLTVGMPHLRITTTGSAGKRAFFNEHEALVLVNETDPYRFGMKILAEYTPFSFPFTLYYIYRYTKYEPYTSNFHLGGMYIQW